MKVWELAKKVNITKKSVFKILHKYLISKMVSQLLTANKIQNQITILNQYLDKFKGIFAALHYRDAENVRFDNPGLGKFQPSGEILQKNTQQIINIAKNLKNPR